MKDCSGEATGQERGEGQLVGEGPNRGLRGGRGSGDRGETGEQDLEANPCRSEGVPVSEAP